MRLRLIAPAKKPEWGEEFWGVTTLGPFIGTKFTSPPLGLVTLAALCPPDIEVAITDENVEPIDFDEQVDLVGITGTTPLAPRAYEIADAFRKRNVAVVLGGIHASMLPEEALQHADAVLIGEAESTWAGVIDDCREGRLRSFYSAKDFPALSDSPAPRWDLLQKGVYEYYSLQTGRGCPYDCDFCSVKIFNGRKYRHKPIENVVREVEALQRIATKKIIFFADDNLLAVPSYARRLMDALSPLGINWTCQVSANRLKDDSLLEAMYRAGCRQIFIGFESVSPVSLDSMKKDRVNKVDEYLEVVDKVHSHGLGICGSFVLGNDEDDESIFQKTSSFIEQANLAFSMINLLTPFPGTSLYKRLKSEGRLLHEEWEKYNAEWVCFQPKRMSPEVLFNQRNDTVRKLNTFEALEERLKNLWSRGVYVRNKNTAKRIFDLARIYLTIKALTSGDWKRKRFIIRGLWNPHDTHAVSIVMALSCQEYAQGLQLNAPTRTAKR
jgi:radical SAM superfamily enzyme YgiQ (UPF0313 family)